MLAISPASTLAEIGAGHGELTIESAIIDYPERGRVGDTCHCIAKAALIAQVAAQGFDVIADEDRWSGIRCLVVFGKR